MKKWDLRIDSHGKADIMRFGFFEEIHGLRIGSKPLDLIEIVGTNGITYRVDHKEAESEAIQRFLKALDRRK